MSRDEFDAMLREQIAKGEITPDEAENEYWYFVNRFEDTLEGVYGR